MITTDKCVVCLGEATVFGGHVHKGDETVIAGTCKEHSKLSNTGRERCMGCYGEWGENMGYKDPDSNSNRTYGTDKSELLKKVIDAGFKPIAITIMICEETFVFKTNKEATEAYMSISENDGWWYGLDGKYPWNQTWKEYVDKHYDGDESKAPKVYWLNEKIKK